MTKEVQTYEERFTNLWVSKEDYQLYGEEKYSEFEKTRERDLKGKAGTCFRGFLVVDNKKKYWLSFNTRGSVSQIIDVTKAKFYDDTENEDFILNTQASLVGGGVRYIPNPYRGLILELISILQDAGVVAFVRERHLEFKPSKVIRDDISSFLGMDNYRITVSQECQIIEEANSFLIVFLQPYEELKRISKNSILGIYKNGSTELIIEESEMFKLETKD